MAKKELIGLLKKVRHDHFTKVEPNKRRAELWGLLTDQLLEPIISPKYLGLTYATIKYWESKHFLVLPATKDTDEWRKFSVLELLWVEVLKKLVDMGCSLDKVVPRLIHAYQHHSLPTQQIPYDATVKEEENPVVNYVMLANGFLTHIMFLYQDRGKSTLHFFSDASCFLSQNYLDEKVTTSYVNDAMYRSGLSISISNILYKMTNMQELNKKFSVPNVFTPEEVEIIKMLRNNELKEVTVKLENGKPVSVELKEQFDHNKDAATKRLNELITSPYQEIKAVTNGGKTIYYERITKQKIKK